MQKEQRVGVFVDVQNLYYSARNLYKSKINFKELLKEAVAGRKLIRAIAYSIRAGEKDEDSFYKALEEIGFEVKAKQLQIFYGGNKKGDWDVGIAMDAIELAHRLDTIVLISGDGNAAAFHPKDFARVQHRLLTPLPVLREEGLLADL